MDDGGGRPIQNLTFGDDPVLPDAPVEDTPPPECEFVKVEPGRPPRSASATAAAASLRSALSRAGTSPPFPVGFQLPEASDVRLVVYDVMQRKVAVLVSEAMEVGTLELAWDGRDARAGRCRAGCTPLSPHGRLGRGGADDDAFEAARLRF